jgi:hypothetical protein
MEPADLALNLNRVFVREAGNVERINVGFGGQSAFISATQRVKLTFGKAWWCNQAR